MQTRPDDSLQSKLWTNGSRSLRLTLHKRQWKHLLSYFDVPDGLTTTQANDVRTAVTLDPERRDYLDRALFSQPPT
jgi:hypothetical protein